MGTPKLCLMLVASPLIGGLLLLFHSAFLAFTIRLLHTVSNHSAAHPLSASELHGSPVAFQNQILIEFLALAARMRSLLHNVPIHVKHFLSQTTLTGNLAGVEWLRHSRRSLLDTVLIY